jgi:CMD domain protein
MNWTAAQHVTSVCRQSQEKQAMTDVLNEAAGIAADSPLARLRAQRPDFVTFTQGSHDAMVTPANPEGVSLVERAACALRVAVRTPHARLAAHYRTLLRRAGADAATITAAESGTAAPDARLQAILRHVDMLATAPGRATQADLRALGAAGLGPKEIVTISQIAAFVAYQARVATGMALMAAEHAA